MVLQPDEPAGMPAWAMTSFPRFYIQFQLSSGKFSHWTPDSKPWLQYKNWHVVKTRSHTTVTLRIL